MRKICIYKADRGKDRTEKLVLSYAKIRTCSFNFGLRTSCVAPLISIVILENIIFSECDTNILNYYGVTIEVVLRCV